MSTTALVFWIIALCLAAFGTVFVLSGQNSERSYWSQRDPEGNARREATPLSAIARRAGHYATGEYRAPLRITAIGVLLIEIGLAFALVALVATLVG